MTREFLQGSVVGVEKCFVMVFSGLFDTRHFRVPFIFWFLRGIIKNFQEYNIVVLHMCFDVVRKKRIFSLQDV